MLTVILTLAVGLLFFVACDREQRRAQWQASAEAVGREWSACIEELRCADCQVQARDAEIARLRALNEQLKAAGFWRFPLPTPGVN